MSLSASSSCSLDVTKTAPETPRNGLEFKASGSTYEIVFTPERYHSSAAVLELQQIAVDVRGSNSPKLVVDT